MALKPSQGWNGQKRLQRENQNYRYLTPESLWGLEIEYCKLFQTVKVISDQCVCHAVTTLKGNESTQRNPNSSIKESESPEENGGIKISHKGSVAFIPTLLCYE